MDEKPWVKLTTTSHPGGTYVLLYPKGAKAGSLCRLSGSLVEGSVWTLKNYFKSICRM